MLPLSSEPLLIHQKGNYRIYDFSRDDKDNVDRRTVMSFADEWNKFNSFTDDDIQNIGHQYFDIVDPATQLGKDKIALDLGCGSGRWSKYLAPQIGFIEAIDPSEAVFAAAQLLGAFPNVRISKASSDNIPFTDESFDFVFSIGVLHHVPDTQNALLHAVRKLKKNGHLLLYIYYNLDNRGRIYRSLFRASNILRKYISGLPPRIKYLACDLMAVLFYFPFVLLSKFVRLFAKEGYKKIPLSYYVDKRFYIQRNDALDRFGTPLEQRFSKEKIRFMMEKSGLSDIIFSEHVPYWHAIGRKL